MLMVHCLTNYPTKISSFKLAASIGCVAELVACSSTCFSKLMIPRIPFFANWIGPLAVLCFQEITPECLHCSENPPFFELECLANVF